jgi:hypothetical protein
MQAACYVRRGVGRGSCGVCCRSGRAAWLRLLCLVACPLGRWQPFGPVQAGGQAVYPCGRAVHAAEGSRNCLGVKAGRGGVVPAAPPWDGAGAKVLVEVGCCGCRRDGAAGGGGGGTGAGAWARWAAAAGSVVSAGIAHAAWCSCLHSWSRQYLKLLFVMDGSERRAGAEAQLSVRTRKPSSQRR